ncbi:ATP-binding protein [Cesiribacter sp. SM1]|uniref:sensor histidine kinase n=1 Tax=Cesiribacter sp. SM1 TaxID=2861196 RepID=UPI001CD4727E|nr:PAS domain-containing sensor histidine kinase [Cesiribacter sp. SM1]
MNPLFDTLESNFMPHGHCYYWEPYILWSHAISDSIIALAYLTIPLSLIKIVRSRKEDDFAYMWMLILFAAFILGCGATHIMDVVNIWEPWYLTDSAIRIITALASIGTAIMLMRITPQLIMLPSGRRWKEMNEELRALNEQLEQKVKTRTEELEKLAAHYKFMTDAIPQIVWSANPDGKTDYLNKTWYTYTGQDEQLTSTGNWQQLVHPDDLATARGSWKESMEKGIPFEAKMRIADKTGEYCWFLTRALPMTNNKGQLEKWFGTSTNINDQIVKNQELERTNEELDNFVYTASHDLKTPILNIEGLLQLIKSKVPAGENKDLLNIYSRIDKSVNQLKETIHDLADITRIQRESAEESHWINLPELIEEFKVNHQLLYESTAATLEADLEEEEICCISRKHMRSLLDNLLSNALKYRHPSRPPHVQIKSEQEDHWYKISIHDNGIGIAPEHQPRVFDMFKRFHSHTPGTGVGLYIVKKIIEKYAGRITVQSAPEIGTTFTVWLKQKG